MLYKLKIDYHKINQKSISFFSIEFSKKNSDNITITKLIRINMSKKGYLYFLVPAVVLLPVKALAFCPVCTVAAAAAVGLSRWLGVDDTISGLWIGGLTISAIGWTINWLRKKKINFWWSNLLVALVYYGMIMIPFYKIDIISFHPSNLLWGVDKLFLGIIIGSLFFVLGNFLYQYVKEKNGGHAHFPFEKIVFPVTPLLILSLTFYLITKN
ncbi:MAG: hypothetical protein WC107_07100 [Patescibacteria group bacterium]